MSATAFAHIVDLTAGLALVMAYTALWQRGLVSIIRTLALQGAAVALLALAIGVHGRRWELIAIAGLVGAVKAVAIPKALLRAVRSGDKHSGSNQETEPLVNLSASLVAGVLLTTLAFFSTHPLVGPHPTPELRAVPIGVSIVLLGFFIMVTRQKAPTQVVGFLLLDNGVAMVGFLATGGVPLAVELGVTLDLLAAVLVLEVLATRMWTKFGGLELDNLRELHE